MTTHSDVPSTPYGTAVTATILAADQLTALRSDFPAFRIWQETTGDRNRYVARSLHPDTRPHTVVTADLDELRAILAAAPSPLAPPQDFETGARRVGKPVTAGKAVTI